MIHIQKINNREFEMRSLLILGAGGFGQMVKETALQLGYENVVFLDDAAKGSDEMCIRDSCLTNP